MTKQAESCPSGVPGVHQGRRVGHELAVAHHPIEGVLDLVRLGVRAVVGLGLGDVVGHASEQLAGRLDDPPGLVLEQVPPPEHLHRIDRQLQIVLEAQGGFGEADLGPVLTIEDIAFGDAVVALAHQGRFDDVLDFLDARSLAPVLPGEILDHDLRHSPGDAVRAPAILQHFQGRPLDGPLDLGRIEFDDRIRPAS